MAQGPSIDAGPDQVVCPPDCVTITATYVGGGGNTADYTVAAIPFAPDAYAGTSVAISDDGTSPSIPIGFEFCFYGNTYTNFYIGANGWVGFTGPFGSFTPVAIPSIAATTPKNCVMGPWQDLNPGIGGTIRHQVLGVAPSRRLVVTWQTVPFFSCTGIFNTQQIILYEGTNEIENHIETKLTCPGWVGGRAVQGVHNIDGTEAVVNPGRNNTVWAVDNDAIRYTPVGDPDVYWYDEDGLLIGTDATITLCPDETTTYTAVLVSCGMELATDDVTVTAVCCEPPVMSKTDVTCFGACDGTGTADPMGLPPFTFLWDPAAGSQTTATATGLCPGTYTVQVFDAAGCIEEGTVTITEPDELTIDTDLTHVTCFGGSDAEISVTVSGGTAPFTYDIGAGPALTGNFTGLTAGSYTVTVVDANGCTVSEVVTLTEDPLPVVSFSSADGIYDGCEPFTITFVNDGELGVLNEWSFGDGSYATALGTVEHTYETHGTYTVTLTVTDADGCSNFAVYPDLVTVHEVPEADFSANPSQVSTQNPQVLFTDHSSIGGSWLWEFASFGGSDQQNPSFLFPDDAEGTHEITLTVSTIHGCTDQVTKIITIVQERLIFAPNAITPDGDLFNEVFKPYLIGIDIYDYHLTIFNRWGEIIFESYDETKGWNGTYGGEVVETGTYVWKIVAADIITDKIHEFGGHVTVLK